MRLSASEARARFAASRVARLATASASGVPHLVPVTFAVAGDEIVFAVDHKPKSTTSLRRLANIAENPSVTFLVDVYSDDWTQLWWARADGVARVLDASSRAEPVSWLVAKYPQYTEHPPEHAVVSTVVRSWRGWAAS
ncbi:TIGR03668 family PPOX class F420-dependent oxidoreductase [Amycolatopsis sp. FDAARGOS 1241]|uniref:TIGR03668 family PPOX class F420-dependent oxidoreductase n=1 Tax=Amycolatopsis sp. FDAARGOS 1241 TaxID=2778070 RepID=UPI0019504F99|nr:TIGR03668 family PPOX class F420-dependent oxidoreductase [Amycolatopsis sp. FDAARGOS 1241]QRP49921.1 TIGR03668 family PPOX class F420-dependent oxidoreductase [Amycolatopsis sp. FDAARGOS 1241]